MYNLRKKSKSNNKITKRLNTNKSAKSNNLQTSHLNMEATTQEFRNTSRTPPRSRLRESLLNSQLVTSRLTNTDSPFKIINVMDKRFDKLTEQLEKVMEKKLNEYKNELLSDLDKRFKIMKVELQEITQRVSSLETVAVEIKSMQEEIVFLKTQIKRQENNTVVCKLRLNEIPYQENENLIELFGSICNSIKTSVPAIKSIYRLQNHNNTHERNSRDAVIIVKMWSSYDKNFFLKSLANYKKINRGFTLTLKLLGFNSDNKFYINENLTKDNFQIFRTANRFRKRKLLHSAFTMRGFVYIKRWADDNIIRIEDIRQLYELFPDSENSTNANRNDV